MTVFTIAGEHVVVLAYSGNRSDCDCFLSDVQVTEAADLARDVRFRRFFFKDTNQEHLAVEVDERLGIKTTQPFLLSFLSSVSFATKLFAIDFRRRVNHASGTSLFGSGSRSFIWGWFTHVLANSWGTAHFQLCPLDRERFGPT